MSKPRKLDDSRYTATWNREWSLSSAAAELRGFKGPRRRFNSSFWSLVSTFTLSTSSGLASFWPTACGCINFVAMTTKRVQLMGLEMVQHNKTLTEGSQQRCTYKTNMTNNNQQELSL